ncbi:MAG: ribonuclease P protein component [Armatimonadetes bacterium]|nr:ribonuclease P protein component [Armatimonadota bacterium]
MKFITSNKDYKSIFIDNKKNEGNFFIFLYQENSTNNVLEVGIIAGKKVGNAVIRNKVKRHIKSFLRENKDSLPSSLKVVIIAKQNSGNATWLEYKEELTRLFSLINY